jgi:hypothetical protein
MINNIGKFFTFEGNNLGHLGKSLPLLMLG